jgi:hypothetical protein
LKKKEEEEEKKKGIRLIGLNQEVMGRKCQ